ncbi:MAG TPA: nucleotidyltransferase family protein [Pyrinomonadaceae bacterium]|nr:nucleotidyltransferase family protein [Pyrinomonadaceae bacterium]
MKTCTAVLLAAGRSRRMGAFKPLLPFGNKTVIECCIDSLREGGVETIVVVLGHRADDVREKVTGVGFALNPDPDSEMGVSIAAGIRELPRDAQATFIALVDYPAVPATVVSTIIKEWTNGAEIVIPTWQGRGGHPVLVDLKFRPELMKLPANGGLRAFFEAHREAITRLQVESPFIARDMDTWDDYRALHLEATGKPAPEPPQN